MLQAIENNDKGDKVLMDGTPLEVPPPPPSFLLGRGGGMTIRVDAILAGALWPS